MEPKALVPFLQGSPVSRTLALNSKEYSMNTSPESKERCAVVRNSLRTEDKIVHRLPEGAVLTSVLKTIETQLQKRGLLPYSAIESFNPIWFLAETERNIYLWRRGLSIDNAEKFEFWINITSLLEKRLRQLETGLDENPFVNSLWGTGGKDEHSKQRELNYILTFRDMLEKIHDHAQALSKASSLLEDELLGERQNQRVLLI